MEENINELKDHEQKIQELKNDLVKLCKKEIEEILEKHGCKIVGVPMFVPGQNGWNVRVGIEIHNK